MGTNQETGFRIDVEVKTDAVVSDGAHEVSVKCIVRDKNGKSIRDEIPVNFSCPKQKVKDQKISRPGGVTFKFKPRRPTGKTKILVSTSLAAKEAFIFVKPTPAQYIRDLIQAVVLAFIIAFGLIRPFILQTYYIPSGSMEPTLYEGDRVIGLMFPYRLRDPKPGEIAIFRRQGEYEHHLLRLPFHTFRWKTQTNFIKRVMATGGDTVEIRDLTVYVNHKPIKEPYIMEPPMYDMPALKLPAKTLFMMGDNRNNSNDSHLWGPLPRGKIMAKAWIRFWPLNRIRIIR